MAIFACCASAQTPAANQEQMFYFQPATTAQRSQETVIAIRTLSTTAQVSSDEAQGTVTVHGTASQIAVAGWLFHQLEGPSGGASPAPPPPASPVYVVPGAADDVVRVFYPANINTPQGLQQLTNAIRTLGDIQRMMACTQSGAVVLRGTAAQVALAEWLVNALDKPDGWKPQSSQNWAAYQYENANPPSTSSVRVFYPSNAGTQQGLTEVVNLTRTLGDLQRLFPVSAPRAVVFRSTAAQAALAEWVLNALDKPNGWQPPAGQNPVAYQYNEDPSPTGGGSSVSFVRVFYLPAVTPQDLQAIANQLRTSTGCQRLMAAGEHDVVALRGTASQTAAAEQLVAGRYPPSPKP
jgi:hypothetical protein